MPISSAALLMLPPWRRSALSRKSRSNVSTTAALASRNERDAGAAAAVGRRLGRGVDQIGHVDLRAGRQQQRLLDRRAQLAHVALPDVLDAGAQRGAGQRLGRAAEALRRVLQEVLDQQRNVLAPLGERRDDELDDAQPVVEILAELPGAHRRLEILVGGGEHAHVDLERLVAADALELALLQRAQQLGLRLERHVADLVEEQRAAVGGLELAFAARDGAGEGAALVAEQLALDQLAAERGAVHLDQRLAAARAAVVQRVGHQLLAGAALAADQHGDVGVGDLGDGLEDARASPGCGRRSARSRNRPAPARAGGGGRA